MIAGMTIANPQTGLKNIKQLKDHMDLAPPSSTANTLGLTFRCWDMTKKKINSELRFQAQIKKNWQLDFL